jgi:hypothetical protein
MKRILIALILCLALGGSFVAQQRGADSPATAEDVQKYLDVMHSRDMMQQMVDAMSKPMHQMVHDQFEKDRDKLPPDFEVRMNRMMEDMFKGMPFDEMLQAMVPVYQKHFTKGELEALVAFYSSPTGQKVLREMPAILAESMQSMMPIMSKQMDAMNQRLQKEIAEMLPKSQN